MKIVHILIILILLLLAVKTGVLKYVTDLAINHPKIFALLLLPTPIPDFGLSLIFATIIGFLLPEGFVNFFYYRIPYRKKIEELLPSKLEKYVARIVMGYIIITIIALLILIFYFNEPWAVIVREGRALRNLR